MFKPGQRIVFVDEPGTGKVQEVLSDGFVIVEDEHGFSRTYPKYKIAAIRVPDEKLNSIASIPKNKSTETVPKKVEKHNAKPVIMDLHIHELVDRHEHWTNTEIVNFQMNFLKRELEQLMRRRVKIVHIIHGVGEGVLRTEVRHYLRSFANCEINDLAYTRNGFGATEFIIRYKGNV
jgi:hypothetical protein